MTSRALGEAKRRGDAGRVSSGCGALARIFAGASVSGAGFTGARFTGARFTGARFTGVRFTGPRFAGHQRADEPLHGRKGSFIPRKAEDDPVFVPAQHFAAYPRPARQLDVDVGSDFHDTLPGLQRNSACGNIDDGVG